MILDQLPRDAGATAGARSKIPARHAAAAAATPKHW
ncbi:hypothetical protein CBM2637_A50052 [Cupriavidus taiwanensis]|nr:hypothetical protein CBM2637_A50052 [Cupriavidus taiwanensis]SPA47726.1 protein of unknown function [Cupriavidus taiwanensis]